MSLKAFKVRLYRRVPKLVIFKHYQRKVATNICERNGIEHRDKNQKIANRRLLREVIVIRSEKYTN